MIEKIMSAFSENIDNLIHSGDSDLKKAESGIQLSVKTLSKLQKHVNKEDFEDPQSEIDFFRNIKPLPMSYHIYFSQIRNCEINLPKIGNSHKVRFLEKEIKKINQFFSENNSFVSYMEQGHTYLDHLFFSRHGKRDFSFNPNIHYYQYPEFSTSHDMLWSQVQALYRYIHYIREKLEKIEPGSSSNFRERQPNLLVWSGTKTSLVEIIYALYFKGDINHGTVDLKTIVAAFEDFFNIEIDNFYKTYGEIKSRKDPRTKYLHTIAAKLEAKMREDDQK
ncbi:RteC domain-containing protein [Zunongwangia sp. HGR-M22]|uniref:RteC domain-containing protein n=1 Tax=Zunongwangia sp. HGR-M22 TaxID=3015168 RepID=UPI0022DE45E7|nr:RteC domain-containing protein [Zunongwangia sp. HGR-M22]WBL24273.1 RteC domain-containing protein [Zunongwangia sp. HGR-M22]